MAIPNEDFTAGAARAIVTKKDMPFSQARFDELFNYVIDTIRVKAKEKLVSLEKPFENFGGSAPNVAEQQYIYDHLESMGYKVDKVLDGNSDFKMYQIWW